MSDTERDRAISSGPGRLPSPGASKWDHGQIMNQARGLLEKVYAERRAQEDRWGPQNVPNLQKNGNGVHEIGRPYRQFEQIFKYQCDRNRADGHESMDTIWLEEIFESLAAVVALEETKYNLNPEDLGHQATYLAARDHAVEELVQAAAVALKFAGKIERDE